MNFFNNILNKAAKAVTLEDKIFTVSIDKLHFDEDYKAVFKQEEDKVQRIAEDMMTNGFDKSQPIIIDENYAILDGNSRFMACQITKVPVIIKKFESRKDALLYELGLQMNRRNIANDSVLIDTYHTLAEKKDEEGNKLFTDVEIAERLGVSPRQISKAKEVDLKANDELKDALKNGEISLNKAYNSMKEEMKAKEETEVKSEEVTSTPADVKTEASADEAKNATPVAESTPKAKKPASEKPTVEKLSLKFKPEDFALIQNAAQTANLSVTEYAMNILMGSVQASSAETVSEKETA